MYVSTLFVDTWKGNPWRDHGSDYGVATPAEIAGMTGREILQAFIEGRLPQPRRSPRPLSFWLSEVGDGFAVFEGEPGGICSTRWAACTAAGR